MTIKYFVYSILIMTMLFSSLSANAYAQPIRFEAKLQGDNEVPPVNTTATAKAKFTMKHFQVKDDVITSKINVTGITNLTGAHIYAGNKSEIGQPIVDLLKSGKENKTQDRLIITADITASDFEGLMKGKTLEDLRTAMASEGTYVNIQTSNHPDGEIRGQIKVSGGNTTQPESFNTTSTATNTDAPKTSTDTKTDNTPASDDTSISDDVKQNNLINELVKTGKFTEDEAIEFVTKTMQSGTDDTSTPTTSSSDDVPTTSNTDTNADDTQSTNNQANNNANTRFSNNQANNNDQPSNANTNNPEEYDNLNDLIGDIKNHVVDIEDISLNAFQESGAYQGTDKQTQDCIDLAGKIGDNLIDYEIVHCSEDTNFFKNQIANTDDNNNNADDTDN